MQLGEQLARQEGVGAQQPSDAELVCVGKLRLGSALRGARGGVVGGGIEGGGGVSSVGRLRAASLRSGRELAEALSLACIPRYRLDGSRHRSPIHRVRLLDCRPRRRRREQPRLNLRTMRPGDHERAPGEMQASHAQITRRAPQIARRSHADCTQRGDVGRGGTQGRSKGGRIGPKGVGSDLAQLGGGH